MGSLKFFDTRCKVMKSSHNRSIVFSAVFTAYLALISSSVSVEASVKDDDCKIILGSTAGDEIKSGLMDAAASGKLYRVDSDRSSVSFSVRHFPFSRVEGRFQTFDGGLAGYNQTLPYEQVLFVIKSDSVNTGDKAIDALIKSTHFFDAELFPDIVFAGRDIEFHDDGAATIHGEITVRNITRPLTHKVQLDQQGRTGRSIAQELHIRAQTRLNRSEHGMDYLDIIVSDTVELELELYLNRVNF